MVITSKIINTRIDAFELWCGGLLRVPWTARWSNQSILKEINPEYILEGLMLKLKLQYFVHLMQTTDSLEKTLMLEKIEFRRRRGQQRTRWLEWYHQLNGHKFEQGLGDSVGQRGLACCSPWGCKELDTTERLNNNNNKEKVWMLWELLKCDTETWSEKCWKNGSDRFTWQRVVTNFNFVKNTVSGKWNEAMCVKRGTLAWSIPGCDILL